MEPGDHVALGHRRLSIIDLSALAAQPMANEDGTVWVTFNGEIYNFASLRKRLQEQGHYFRSQSDTEVLVHLWEEHGERLVDHLIGDFAFGLWDRKRQELFLARDHLGVKPLYFAWHQGTFLFASEIKAILAYPGFQRRLDERALYHYLTYLVAPAPMTMFHGIEKLRAGEAIVISRGGSVRRWSYWRPLPRPAFRDLSQADERLQELFRQSVERRLISDVPVGLLFSGGVDSTLNCLMFQDIVGDPRVHTYNAVMRGPRFHDESGFAAGVAGLLGTRHLTSDVTEVSLLADIETVIYHLDEPVADPVTVALHSVTRVARADGMTVLHAGEGADELFCGYSIARRFLRHHRALWEPLASLPRGFAAGLFRLLRSWKSPRGMKIADVLRRRGLGQELYMSEAVTFYEHEKERILAPGFRDRMRGIDSFDIVSPLYAEMERDAPDADFFAAMTLIELSQRLPDLLLTRTDKMAMANSIEVRVPFLDKDIVEFALALPLSFKTRNGISKEPVKRLAAVLAADRITAPIPEALGGSPRGLFYRPKSGFGMPTQDWLATGLGADLRGRLRRGRSDWDGILDVSKLDAMVAAGAKTVNQSYQLYSIYAAMVWRERFGV